MPGPLLELETVFTPREGLLSTRRSEITPGAPEKKMQRGRSDDVLRGVCHGVINQTSF